MGITAILPGNKLVMRGVSNELASAISRSVLHP
jgi:hypothetical protein